MPLFVGASESYDTDAWETCNLKKENAKLRELVGLWSVINKHMSLCATTDCGQCPVREECEESVCLEGLLGIDSKVVSWRVQERMAETTDVQAENAKLRELLRDVYSLHWYGADCTECPWFDECDNHGGGCPWLGILANRMSKLGIEVDA